MIRFIHQSREVALSNARADTTVLDYLRDHCALTGTKEGCASGDCGACTVVLAKAESGELTYSPVNACITPLGSIHGSELISVEDLQCGSTWHPVQRAMIECHASQCGFCTPGIVMSLFALYHRRGISRREDIVEALGGNLCRCTGYRPIIDAALQAMEVARDDQFSHRASTTLEQLCAIRDTQTASEALSIATSKYLRPQTAAEIVTLMTQYPHARLLAGGTDLFLEATQSLTPLPVLIDITAATELCYVREDSGEIHFGAAVTLQACRLRMLGEYPELAELLERFGSAQIRAQGTLAGNIANASPVGDWPPVLLALGGSIVLQSTAGTRELPLNEFFLDYRKTALQAGEIIATVVVPRRKDALLLRAYKISKRFDDDISSVCAVFALQLDGDRVITVKVAFGGMAAVAKRAPSVERALTGLDLKTDSIDAAAAAIAEDFKPIDDTRASASYRLTVAARLLQRLQHEHCGDTATRVRLLDSALPERATV